MASDPRAVCLVGAGQRTWRPDDPGLVEGHAPEPLAMWAEVLRAAAADARSTRDPLDSLGALTVIYTQSWNYDDPAGRLLEAIGRPGAGVRTEYTGLGGTRPLQAVRDLAAAIVAGHLDVGAVVGAESLATVRRIKKAGGRPDWSHRHPDRLPFPLEAPFLDTEISHEVFQAWLTFAGWDIGRRARLGLAPDAYRDAIGTTMAPLSAVAARNPGAWFPVERTAGQIVEVTADNRMVGYPYTKLSVAVMDVDMAAALILMSESAADDLGVPREHRVYLRGISYGTDPYYFAEHHAYGEVPGMAAVGAAALAAAGVGIDDVAHLDLYSCFASSVHHARDALRLSGTDERPLTVTGGLPYHGGPGSNYLGHSIATMAGTLRADPGSIGLTSGVGMHMTKHAYALWSTVPPPVAAAVLADDAHVQAGLDARGKKAVRAVARGPAAIATYSVVHGREGGPEWALAVCDLPEGDRCYAKVLDPGLLAAMETEEWVGRSVTLLDGGGGVNLVGA